MPSRGYPIFHRFDANPAMTVEARGKAKMSTGRVNPRAGPGRVKIFVNDRGSGRVENSRNLFLLVC